MDRTLIGIYSCRNNVNIKFCVLGKNSLRLALPRTQRSGPFFTAWCAAEPGPYKARIRYDPGFAKQRFARATRAASRPGNELGVAPARHAAERGTIFL